MGKYSSSSRQAPKPKREETHIIWRGIGCLMMIIIPAISIASAIEIINYGLAHNWAIPYQLLGYITLPDIFYKSSGLMIIFGPLTRIPNLYAYAGTSLLFIVLLGGTISVIYAAVYRMVGPSRWGPTDAPPPKIKTKRYTR